MPDPKTASAELVSYEEGRRRATGAAFGSAAGARTGFATSLALAPAAFAIRDTYAETGNGDE